MEGTSSVGYPEAHTWRTGVTDIGKTEVRCCGGRSGLRVSAKQLDNQALGVDFILEITRGQRALGGVWVWEAVGVNRLREGIG